MVHFLSAIASSVYGYKRCNCADRDDELSASTTNDTNKHEFCFREAGAAATANVHGSAREQPSQLLRLAKGHAHLKSSGFCWGGLPKPPGRLGSISPTFFIFFSLPRRCARRG